MRGPCACNSEMDEAGESSIVKPAHAVQCDLCGLSHRTGRKCGKQVSGNSWFCFFLNVFLLLFWKKVLSLHYSFLWAQWYTSGDVCSMFQSQCGTIACVLHHLHAMWSPDSPLARHLLSSWWPAAKPFLIHRTTHHSISIANNKFCFVSQSCKGHLKDTIINFRDHLEDGILDRATEESRRCDLFLCLGTTLLVTPAADLVDNMREPQTYVVCNRYVTFAPCVKLTMIHSHTERKRTQKKFFSLFFVAAQCEQ